MAREVLETTIDGKAPLSRRRFIADLGLIVGGTVAATTLAGCEPDTPEAKDATYPLSIPVAKGFLLVDHVKCAGCMVCMMACSLANQGVVNPSLSRIQIVQSSFNVFPNDIRQYQCRQCQTPVCVTNCPTGAAHIDTAHGNIRVIDEDVCIGCKQCLESCPQMPHRTIWNPIKQKSSKCDLCLNAKYLGAEGGPGGTQACVAACPMQAIKFTEIMPNQTGDVGYDVNLRNENAVDVQISEVPVRLED